MFFRIRGTVCIAALVVITGCGSSKQPGQPTRTAVLRCENLSGDAAADWMGRAISEILISQLSAGSATQVIPAGNLRNAGAGMRPAQAPGISTEREAALVSGANRIVACEYSVAGGVVRLSAQVEDAVAVRIIQRAQAEGPLLAAADSVARQIAAQVRPFPTRNQDAVHAYADGMDATDPSVAGEAYKRAVTADPNFGPGYLGWVSAELQRRNREGADHVLELAKARGDAIPAYERAQLALGAAELKGDNAAKIQALGALTKAGPSDPAAYRGLAEAALQGRRYREAINAYEKALAVTPDDVALLNSLGYAQAYLGDLNRALDALRKYERLQPKQANPLDSQADVNFYSGHYAEAEKLYLAAQDRDPNFAGGAEILKAAQARLATGDIPGADAIFQRYASALDSRHDPGAPYRKAQWKYLTGHRREAIAMLSADTQPLSQAQAALWELALGMPSASGRVAKAGAAAQRNSPLLLVVASVLTQPQTSAAEWEARATRVFAQSPLRDQCVAYALLFGRDFRAALPYLRRAWDATNPNNEEGLPVLLAWAMLETGQAEGATSLIGPTPIPQAAGPGPLMTLYFPRLFYMRARNYERLGKHDQALENYRLFLKLAGSDAEIWGEEAQTRKALGQ